MSAIDTFNHVHVGMFCNLPVYWILEEKKLANLTDDSKDENKLINKYYLSIGGGSGEHPALIVNNDAVLFHFVKCMNEVEKPSSKATEAEIFDYKMFELGEKINKIFFDEDNGFKNKNEEICYWDFDKNQWPLNTFVEVGKLFEDDSNQSLESKMMESMALFIINEMPLDHCIQNEDLKEFAKMVKSNRWQNVFDWKSVGEKFKGFSGVMNCQKNGKIIKDGQVVWSYGLNDWIKDN